MLVYADGTVQCSHGGVEMGQGLHTKMAAVCAHELGVPVAWVRVMATRTDKVPNTSATAASSGTDLNGAAVQDACRTLVARMAPVREALTQRLGRPPAFDELAHECWVRRVSLAATGFYATPGIVYDEAAGHGTPL